MDDREELLVRCLAGPLSGPDVIRMNAIATEPAFVDALVRNTITHDLLRRKASAQRGTARAIRFLEHLAVGTASRGTCSRREVSTRDDGRSALTHRLAWITALAIAVFAATAVIWRGGGDGPSTWTGTTTNSASSAGTSVAKFSRSANAEWMPKAHRWSVGDVLNAGDRLELSAGRVELVFDSGAVMTLVGPARIEIHSTNAVALHGGTATTRVENAESNEFRVLTPSTDVVDLGTEFGVRVEAGGTTDVVVFDGAVDLVPSEGSTANGTSYPARRLSSGEAVRADGAGGWARLMAIESHAFPFGDGIFDLKSRRRPVIAGISDDRRSPESPKFYCIYHQGLDEDVRAFVDRPYQWNGVGDEGIPSFLRGADYVATFNDDRRLESPTIRVELVGPAMLYVFYDDRMIVPDWLAGSFEDTGFNIGLDEGGVNRKRPTIGAGPGESIDQVCSIWRLRIDGTASVTLGPIGESTIAGTPASPDKPRAPLMRQERTMYGIAAQPL